MAKTNTVLSRAFDLFKSKTTVTPSELDALTPTGKYSSKHVLYLKIRGYQFVVDKTGKTVNSYTILNPDFVPAKPLAYVPKEKPVKVEKVKSIEIEVEPNSSTMVAMAMPAMSTASVKTKVTKAKTKAKATAKAPKKSKKVSSKKKHTPEEVDWNSTDDVKEFMK